MEPADLCGLCRRPRRMFATAQVSVAPHRGEGRGVRVVLISVCQECAQWFTDVADRAIARTKQGEPESGGKVEH